MSTRVMLVDDPSRRAATMRAALEAEGYRVIATVAPGEDRYQRVMTLCPDVVLVDSESGQRDVLEHLGQRSARYPRPVILLNGEHDAETPAAASRAGVSVGVGFIHLLTKEIRDGHPCCAFAIGQRFAEENPNTFGALFKAIVDATHYASNPANRGEIAEAIAPASYLNQPAPVVQQVLTGRYADGLGEVQDEPDRIDFDPFPWHSMGVWILTQMKRWGYVREDIDYKAVAEQVYLATDCARLMRELGYEPPASTYRTHVIMGKTFDPERPREYVESFDIRRA